MALVDAVSNGPLGWLRAHCLEKLSPFKVPKQFAVFAPIRGGAAGDGGGGGIGGFVPRTPIPGQSLFPTTATGKVQKHKLAAMVLEQERKQQERQLAGGSTAARLRPRL
jgi:hypothetical protein